MYDLRINELWDHGIEKQWLERLDSYWNMKSVRDNLSIEREMDCIHNDLQQIIDMDGVQFYEFLYQKYFVWKYTAKNRLTTTRNKLETQTHDSLSMIKDSMFALYEYIRDDTELLMMNVMRIKGLGVAGASGLLSIFFPKYFGTVDQFVVKSLIRVKSLSEDAKCVLSHMDPESMDVKDGVYIERLLIEKANDLNNRFETDFWTPRKIDMVLWTYRESEQENKDTQ